MQFSDFAETARLVACSSYSASEARFDAASGGSWFLVVERGPNIYRVLWHGPERWLGIEAARGGNPRRRGSDWQEWWRTEPDAAVSPAEILQALERGPPPLKLNP